MFNSWSVQNASSCLRGHFLLMAKRPPSGEDDEPPSKRTRIDAGEVEEGPLAAFVQGLVLPELWPRVPACFAWTEIEYWSPYELRTRLDWDGPFLTHILLSLLTKAANAAHLRLLGLDAHRLAVLFNTLVGLYGDYIQQAGGPVLDFVGVLVGHSREFASGLLTRQGKKLMREFVDEIGDLPGNPDERECTCELFSVGNYPRVKHLYERLNPMVVGEVHSFFRIRNIAAAMRSGNGRLVEYILCRMKNFHTPASLTMMCLAEAALPVLEHCWHILDMGMFPDADSDDEDWAINGTAMLAIAQENKDKRVLPWLRDHIAAEEENADGELRRWPRKGHGLNV